MGGLERMRRWVKRVCRKGQFGALVKISLTVYVVIAYKRSILRIQKVC